MSDSEVVFVGYEGGGSIIVGLGRGFGDVEGEEVDAGFAVEDAEPEETGVSVTRWKSKQNVGNVRTTC
jgi:hypothetical protein